jgi:hypothetical protein
MRGAKKPTAWPPWASCSSRYRPFLGQQLTVRAVLDQLPVVDDEDLAGVADRREPVGDHERGAPFIRRPSASRITASVRESIEDVGSSRIRIGASLRNARPR